MSEYQSIDNETISTTQNQTLGDSNASGSVYLVEDYKDENNLKSIGKLIMVIGIFSGIIVLLAFGWSDEGYYSTHYVFNPLAIGISICTIVSSVTTYFLFNVISNISISLKILSNKE